MVTCVADPETRHRRGGSAFRRITIALFCAGLGTFGTRYALQPLLPVLSAAFHLSPAAASPFGLGRHLDSTPQQSPNATSNGQHIPLGALI